MVAISTKQKNRGEGKVLYDMAIRFFNTMSRSLEEFHPIAETEIGKPCKVGLYTCGPTVHDSAHISNVRTYVFADILRR